VAAEQIVGRAAELQTLDQALEELRRGRPAALELVGEPGIGKTRLLEELGAHAEARGQTVLAGSASEFEEELPFWVFVDALDEYVEGLEPRRLEAIGAATLAELSHVLPSRRGDGNGAPVERFRIHRAVRELLETLAADKPLVLLLDDLHWADSGSVELLGMLLRRPPDAGVLLALAVRPRQIPERLSGALERALQADTLRRVDLGPLTEAEARELLGGAVAHADYEESGGNPFYLQQLTRFHGASAAGSVSIGGARVPRTIAASLAGELATLSEGARRVLEGAAVAGDPFEPELAAAAAAVSEPDALTALDELLGGDLVRPTDVPRRFRFRHPLVRSAVYDAAPGGWRLTAHEHCADALAARGAPAATRAHHVEHAARHGDMAAVAVLREAGEAVIQQTPAGAARWFEAALRLLPAGAPAEQRIQLHLALAGSLAAAGRFADARTALLEIEALVPAEAVPMRVELTVTRALVEGLMGRHQAALTVLTDAVGSLDDIPAPQGVKLHMHLVANAIYRHDHTGAREWAARAHAVAVQLGDRAQLASATATLGLSEAMSNAVPEARRRCETAAAIFDAMGDEELAAWVGPFSQLSAAELYLDRFRSGTVHAERAIAVARATGQAQLFPMFAPILGWTYFVQGRLAESAELLDGAAEAARLTGSPHALTWALFTRVMVTLHQGDIAGALADGEESIALTRELDASNVVTSWAHLALGLALVESGEHARGLEVALPPAGGASLPVLPGAWRAYFLDRFMLAWLALGRRAEAERAAAEARALADATGLSSVEAAALRAAARLALDAGDAHTAAELGLASAEIAESVGAPLGNALSRLFAGRALAAAGEAERAVTELTQAAYIFGSCGSVRYRDEAERELGRLGRRRARRTGGSGFESLTERELEVARLIVDRRTNPQIAAALFLSQKTVETHIRNLFQKLGVSSRVDVARLVERADREGALR
jgi:DNA-binding NarL/FixJ family response regulator